MTERIIKTTIEAHTIDPAQRQRVIFDEFTKLLPGETLLLINDHDSKLLYQALHAEFGELFIWSDEKSGPPLWQTHISRISACCA